MNRLETVTDPDNGITTYTYDNMGNRKTVTYPNGTVAEYTYDTLNRLTYLKNRKSTGEIISSYTYTLGPAGNRTKVVEDSGRVVDYVYDAVYRLTGEQITDPTLGNENITYTYDAFGNRLTKTDSSGTVTYSYDANDRLLTEGANSYIYDNNGNTLSKNDGIDTTTHTYDYENRLIAVQTPSSQLGYAYDTDGIRVASTVDGAVTNYLVDKNRDYAQVLEERDGSGSLIVSYTYGDDLISQNREGAHSYYHYDAQSSTRILTNAAETVTDTYVYDAFGSLTDQAGVTANNYMYTGEQYDPNAGLYYLRARYMNPEIGRFVTTDPFGGCPFEPVSLHKYLYANANPIMFNDPSGRQSTLASHMTAIAISTALVSLFLPIANDPYEGYAHEFWLSFEGGGLAGFVLYGGNLNAKIRAFDDQRKTIWVGYYNVFLIGFGGGGGLVEFSGYHKFRSNRPRNYPDFEGFGRITMGEYGFGRPSLGMGGILLPSGDYIPVDPSLSLGISGGPSIYVTLAFWDFLWLLSE